jgi:8-oxo-dGTP pyrophosphatase MutT (NUDIX family)
METYATIHAVAQNIEGQYLILQRAADRTSPGKWNFITGYIKERESAEEAALRELKEEANLEGEVLKTTEPWWRDHDDGKRFVIITSLIKIKDQAALKVDTRESQAYKWVSPEDDIVQGSSIMREDFIRLGLMQNR